MLMLLSDLLHVQQGSGGIRSRTEHRTPATVDLPFRGGV
jgi:hypothetical protein